MLEDLIRRWKADPEMQANIAAWEIVPARTPRWAGIPAELHPDIKRALERIGVQALYSHQAQVWEHIRRGEHVALASGTASGKTLAYNLPVLDQLFRQPESRALYLFPTKALAQDQLNSLKALLPPARQSGFVRVYDGDTPRGARVAIRNSSRILLTNPDMLHIGILPRHAAWEAFFTNLRFVVLDEMHVYRGVFGSHVANLLRRLKRIAHFYGAQPQFILTSATIGNPQSLAERLIEALVTLIDQDGSARGEKHFILYNPPLIDPELGLRASLLGEAAQLAADLVSSGLQTLLFGRSRRSVELLLRQLREIIPLPDESIRAYRSGYLPRRRRAIEAQLRSGAARVVATTNALELGLDIGSVEATVQAGYPGSIAATWQQAGRAGRGEAPSLSVLVTASTPGEQYLARHPEYFFGRSPEQALINPDNLLILFQHLQCAAFELPFKHGEHFGGLNAAQVAELLDLLTENGKVRRSKEKYFWIDATHPAAEVSLRSASAQAVMLLNRQSEALIGHVERDAALWMVHPGAIYLHEGEIYRVETLDLEAARAWLEPDQSAYYTRPRREATLELLHQHHQSNVPGGRKVHGDIKVTTQVTGYHQISWETGERLGTFEVELPPSELVTHGYWITLDEAAIEPLRQAGLWRSDRNDYGPDWEQIRRTVLTRDGRRCQVCSVGAGRGRLHVHHKIPFRAFDRPAEANRLSNLVTLCPACHQRAESTVRIRSGLSGLAYALGHLAPLLLMCDPTDLGVHADPRSPIGEGDAVIAIYEMIPGGVGFSQHLFDQHNALIARAWEVIANCPCADGCPSCVGAAGENGAGAKAETLALLKQLAAPG